MTENHRKIELEITKKLNVLVSVALCHISAVCVIRTAVGTWEHWLGYSNLYKMCFKYRFLLQLIRIIMLKTTRTCSLAPDSLLQFIPLKQRRFSRVLYCNIILTVFMKGPKSKLYLNTTADVSYYILKGRCHYWLFSCITLSCK